MWWVHWSLLTQMLVFLVCTLVRSSQHLHHSLHIEGVDLQHMGDGKVPEDRAALRVSVEARRFLEWRRLSHRRLQGLPGAGGAAELCVELADIYPAGGSQCWPPALRLGFTCPPCGFAAAHADREVPTGTRLPSRPSSASLCHHRAHLPVLPGHPAPHLHSCTAAHAVGGTPRLMFDSAPLPGNRPSHPQNM